MAGLIRLLEITYGWFLGILDRKDMLEERLSDFFDSFEERFGHAVLSRTILRSSTKKESTARSAKAGGLQYGVGPPPTIPKEDMLRYIEQASRRDPK